MHAMIVAKPMRVKSKRSSRLSLCAYLTFWRCISFFFLFSSFHLHSSTSREIERTMRVYYRSRLRSRSFSFSVNFIYASEARSSRISVHNHNGIFFFSYFTSWRRLGVPPLSTSQLSPLFWPALAAVIVYATIEFFTDEHDNTNLVFGFIGLGARQSNGKHLLLNCVSFGKHIDVLGQNERARKIVSLRSILLFDWTSLFAVSAHHNSLYDGTVGTFATYGHFPARPLARDLFSIRLYSIPSSSRSPLDTAKSIGRLDALISSEKPSVILFLLIMFDCLDISLKQMHWTFPTDAFSPRFQKKSVLLDDSQTESSSKGNRAHLSIILLFLSFERHRCAHARTYRCCYSPVSISVKTSRISFIF